MHTLRVRPLIEHMKSQFSKTQVEDATCHYSQQEPYIIYSLEIVHTMEPQQLLLIK